MYELASEKINNIEEDAYGNVFFNQWYTNEIPYFIETVIKKEIKIPFKYLNDVIELVDEMSNIGIDKYYRKNEKKKVYRNIKKCEPVLDSNDYEKICTGILNKSGWEILLAKYDEGVGADIIAEKGKATVLIKCKKNSSEVDESVVRDVCSGREEYVTDHAAVVTGAEYTESARELALENGVFLLHHNDLGQLEEFF